MRWLSKVVVVAVIALAAAGCRGANNGEATVDIRPFADLAP